MNLCRCEKGHFYDKEKYATCPHCAGGSAADNRLTEAFTEDVTAAVTQPNVPEGPIGFIPTPEPDKTEDYGAEVLPEPTERADDKTIAIYDSFMDTPTVPMAQLQTQTAANQTELGAGAADDDHTVGFYDGFFDPIFSAPQVDVSPKAQPSINKAGAPCVGWLVALGGGHLGQDFRLKAGKNFIGRSIHMDVALTEDKSVSRERHAIVVYEPKAHLYLVQPGESSGLVYKNDEVVLTPVKLEAYDVVTVGEVDLLFMPLCGARFNWGDLLKKIRREDE